VAIGPLVGGADEEGIAWQWIFWLNVPIGLVLAPLALRRLSESHGPDTRLDLPGLGLASAGLLGIVWGLVRGNQAGWSSLEIAGSLTAGAAVLAAFVAWELRAPAPMLPMRFFRNRTFSFTNAASLAMFFGMFGSIFLLSQFLQTAQGYSPFAAGLRVLPWTVAPVFVAPIAGVWGKEIRFRRAAVLVIGSDCASCWCVCCIGSCAASFACSPGAAVSGSSKSSSCAISWRSSGEEGSGRGTRPSTERCWPRPAGCFRPSAGPVLRSARGRFAAGTGRRCLREVAEDAAAGLAVPRLRLRRAA
jgi:hypothetical protein